MKKFLPLLIVLASIGHVYAQNSQLLFDENFTSYSTGNLNTLNSGQGGTYRWTAASQYFSTYFAQVSQSSPLTYPGYTSGTKYVSLTSRADGFFQFPDDPSKDFIGGADIGLTSTETFFMTFVVNVPSSSGVSSTSSATQTLALQTSNGDKIADFFIGKNGSNNLKFGIGKSDGTTSNYSSSTYSYNATHLIVIRLDIVTSGSDQLYMWVDPSNFPSQPLTGSPTASVTSGSDGYSTGFGNTVSALQLFQDDNSATSYIDGIKVAYARNFSTVNANAAAAWDILSPSGAPLPVKFGDLKAYSKDKGVEVEWEVYSEINVDHYEVERSADGVNFYSVGKVTAKALQGKLLYSFYDAAPLEGSNYYRITNVDIDGKSSYSSVVRVGLSSSASAGVSVYPNPVTDKHFSMQLTNLQKGEYTIEVFNAGGQQVFGKQFIHAGGTINQTITLPSTLQRGIYNIRVAGSGFKQAKSILVQ